MYKDIDGTPLPSLSEFWEVWQKVLYTACANQLRALNRKPNYDDVMDLVTEEFALRYSAFQENFHPDYGLPFSRYVVGAMKQSVYRRVVVPGRKPPEQLTENWDVAEAPKPAALLDWERLDAQQTWLAKLMLQGLTLRQIEDRTDAWEKGMTYARLRALKASLAEGIIQAD